MKPSRGTIAMIALVVAASLVSATGGAVAGGMIGTAQIKDGAVTTKKIRYGAVTGPKLRGNAITSSKIKNGSVRTADLAVSARGSKVINYVADDGHVLGGQSITLRLPGRWTLAAIRGSAWSVRLWDGSALLPIPGDYGGVPIHFYMQLGQSNSAYLTIYASSGPAIAIDEFHITRTISTGVGSATTVN